MAAEGSIDALKGLQEAHHVRYRDWAPISSIFVRGLFLIVCHRVAHCPSSSCPRLLEELERVLDDPKVRPLLERRQAVKLLELMKQSDPHSREPQGRPAAKSRDPGDDYLIALAEGREAVLVSGDDDLLALKGQIPVYSPLDFLGLLGMN